MEDAEPECLRNILVLEEPKRRLPTVMVHLTLTEASFTTWSLAYSKLEGFGTVRLVAG